MKNRDEDRSSIFSIFSGLDKIVNVVADMVENNKDEMNINGMIKPDNQKKIIGKYDVNIKLGSIDKDNYNNVKSFNDIFDKNKNTPKIVIPVTDIFEEEDKIIIVSELPGVEIEDIELQFEDNRVTLTAVKKDTCYSKKVALKFIPDSSTIKECLNNSIYSVEIKKR